MPLDIQLKSDHKMTPPSRSPNSVNCLPPDQISESFSSSSSINISRDNAIIPLNCSLNDDFATPRKINIKSKYKPVVKKGRKKSTKGDNKQLRLTDLIGKKRNKNQKKENFDLEYESSENVSGSSTSSNIISLRQNLQQFGFKTGSKHLETITRRPPTEKKKSKFKYTIPTLLLRKDDDRERIISEKVSTILAQTLDEPTPTIRYLNKNELISDVLQKYWNRNSTIFHFQTQKIDELNCEAFYVPSLHLEKTRSNVGCLLKDWSTIAGREKTPKKLSNSQNCQMMPEITPLSPKKIEDSEQNCTSPEIFDSDDELSFQKIMATKVSLDILHNNSSNGKSTSFYKSPSTSSDEVILKNKRKSRTSEITDCNITKSSENNFQSFRKSIKRSHSMSADYNLTARTKTVRRSNSLNVTDYVVNLLNDEVEISTFINSQNNIEIDLTHSDEENVEERLNAVNDLLAANILPNRSKNESIKLNTKVEIDLTVSDEEDGKLNQVTKRVSFTNSNSSHKETGSFEIDIKESVELISPLKIRSLSSSDDQKDLFIKDKQNNSSFVLPNQENFLHKLRDDSFKDLLFLKNNTSYLSINPDKEDVEMQDLYENEDKSIEDRGNLELSTIKKQIDKILTSLSSSSSNSTSDVNLSQESIILSDEELNYSSHLGAKNKLFDQLKNENFDSTPKTSKFNLLEKTIEYCLSDSAEKPVKSKQVQSLIRQRTIETSTPCKSNTRKSLFEERAVSLIETPLKNDVILKTTDITPSVNYDQMNTPSINSELEKFGLKPMKRQRGTQLLKHIYETTHPVVNNEISESDENDSIKVVKKRKVECNEESPKKLSCRKKSKLTEHEMMSYFEGQECSIEILNTVLLEENLIFERKCSKKVYSCQLPLHIAWFNMISTYPKLKETVLLYEPIPLEVVYNMLKKQGYSYHIQDLLTFLDKKCITVRTYQQAHQNHRKKKCFTKSTKK